MISLSFIYINVVISHYRSFYIIVDSLFLFHYRDGCYIARTLFYITFYITSYITFYITSYITFYIIFLRVTSSLFIIIITFIISKNLLTIVIFF